MRASLCVLLVAACALADDSEDRRSKLPYIADAVGNTLPPPSNVPATVGSPVNLLTPDRYEFYTFDESGELVKRLMTLEEIQAIVAAGEETEGLVTFANEHQPTISFNFSQPTYTKVHNVVTNVQNVLKAQMEAHKNRPPTQPTLDTPDVSDSWSLILPSIFGNTGVDIVPDKTSGTFTTPDTEIKEVDDHVDDNSISKEGTNQFVSSSSTAVYEDLKEAPVTEKISTTVKPKLEPSTITTTATTTTTTSKPVTTTTTKPITTTVTITKLSTTTKKLLPTTTSTIKPTTSTSTTTTTRKPTTSKPTTTTNKTRVATTIRTRPVTTSKPRITTTAAKSTTKQILRTTPKATTAKPNLTTRKQITSTQKDNERNFTRIQIQTVANTIPTSEKTTEKYQKLSTFIPISTAAYVGERTTLKPLQTTKPTVASTTKRAIVATTRHSKPTTVKSQPSITTYKPSISTSSSTTTKEAYEKLNATTITTQSVSPSTSVLTTEYMSAGHYSNLNKNKPVTESVINNYVKEKEPELPLFDVAQSFSQIASDLGNYQPIPTTNDLLLDTTQFTDINAESKENIEMEIPADVENEKETTIADIIDKNFVQISTSQTNSSNNSKITDAEGAPSKTENDIPIGITLKAETTTNVPMGTTIDPVLSESMEDLLSQVVNQAPLSIIDPEKSPIDEIQTTTTDRPVESTTKVEYSISETTSKTLEVNNESGTKIIHSPQPANISNHISESKLPLTDETKENKPSNLLNGDRIIVNNTNAAEDVHKSGNYVQISISSNKNVESNPSTIPPNPQTEITVTNDKIELEKKQNQSLPKEDQQPISKLDFEVDKHKVPNAQELSSNVSAANDESSPLKKIENTSSQSDNKITPTEDHKFSNNNAKDKISATLPKIEEFKKKIQKVNIDEKELANERNNSWKLVSTVTPPKDVDTQKDKLKVDSQDNTNTKDIVLDVSKENQGLESTTKYLGEDVAQFTELCNELAFRYWHTMIDNIDKKRSFVLSPYSITSMLAMMFMGARGATSGEMNEILKLDDMVTFNPHFTLKNISDSLEMTPVSGVMISAFVRELFSDRSKGKILTFYKERAQHFYSGHVEEINFKLISDIIRRRTNLLVKRHTWGKIVEYIKANTITMQAPLAAFSVNIFQTDCTNSSVDGRDGEMYFVVSPNVRQRRLVPVPAVVYKDNFLAGYDPVLDATAAALGNDVVSTLFLMPGQQGNVVHAEDLEALEKRLLESDSIIASWKRLLRTLLPRMGLELQIPRFSHKSIFNVSSTLRQMGLKDLFDAEHADLGGLIGPSKDLYLSDMIQSTMFVTCGGGVIGEQHHVEEYPEILEEPQRRRNSRWAAGWDEPRDYQRAFHDPHDVGEAMHLPLHLRPRQARLPSRNAQPARLKFDRPFLYFVRHNPTGMILYVGRYNPRLLP